MGVGGRHYFLDFLNNYCLLCNLYYLFIYIYLNIIITKSLLQKVTHVVFIILFCFFPISRTF